MYPTINFILKYLYSYRIPCMYLHTNDKLVIVQ